MLECLAANAAEIAPARPCPTNRYARIAAALDLAKDTVARALRRLADAGLVAYVPGRADDGRFAPSHYRLTLPADLFVDLAAPTSRRSRTDRTLDPSDAGPSTPTQLSLIDARPERLLTTPTEPCLNYPIPLHEFAPWCGTRARGSRRR